MVFLVVSDRLLGQRLKFEMAFAGVSAQIMSPFDVIETLTDPEGDILIVDSASAVFTASLSSFIPKFAKVVLLSETERQIPGCETLSLPLPIGGWQKALKSKKDTVRFFEEDGKFLVVLDAETISLSKTEYLLFKTLFEANGAFIPRETLMKTVFAPGTTESALNVYIHYLRKKTEKDNRRFIVASRQKGYALKLTGEETVC